MKRKQQLLTQYWPKKQKPIPPPLPRLPREIIDYILLIKNHIVWKSVMQKLKEVTWGMRNLFLPPIPGSTYSVAPTLVGCGDYHWFRDNTYHYYTKKKHLNSYKYTEPFKVLG